MKRRNVLLKFSEALSLRFRLLIPECLEIQRFAIFTGEVKLTKVASRQPHHAMIPLRKHCQAKWVLVRYVGFTNTIEVH